LATALPPAERISSTTLSAAYVVMSAIALVVLDVRVEHVTMRIASHHPSGIIETEGASEQVAGSQGV
jgi:hypothetical protein